MYDSDRLSVVGISMECQEPRVFFYASLDAVEEGCRCCPYWADFLLYALAHTVVQHTCTGSASIRILLVG